MSRKEDFKKASQSLEVQVISNPWTLFEKGCEYGYQYAVEKAQQWIDDNVLEFKGESFVHDFKDCLQDFRKAMEE